ncbi:hypothetical protein GCM10022255_102610 [Dactylosporangium darangshiense]|uniref:Uncharacterized protein n=1 Tax=Dactylosporangium darangshiense TaxID=579108 RepID=A0ABP8DSZ5_9ACTN
MTTRRNRAFRRVSRPRQPWVEPFVTSRHRAGGGGRGGGPARPPEPFAQQQRQGRHDDGADQRDGRLRTAAAEVLGKLGDPRGLLMDDGAQDFTEQDTAGAAALVRRMTDAVVTARTTAGRTSD